MNRAESVRDDVVNVVESVGFTAHGLHVLVGDDECGHHWSPDARREIHSVSKAVAVLAALIAGDAGLVALDAPLADVAPDVVYGSGTAQVTLRDLLAMRSGVDLPWTPTLLTDWPDLAAEFLSRPTEARAFQYSNASSYVAMRVLATHVGDVGDFVAAHLFAPLDITDVAWARCPLGHVAGGEGLALRVEELARIGRLIRDGGRWRGAQIVSGAGVRAMHTAWAPALSSPGYTRYGLGAWDGPGEGWRLHGAYGQLVLFRGDAVVTLLADDHDRADEAAARIIELM